MMSIGHVGRAYADRGFDVAVRVRVAQGGAVLHRCAAHGLSYGEFICVSLDGAGDGFYEVIVFIVGLFAFGLYIIPPRESRLSHVCVMIAFMNSRCMYH